jgi:hypothetical protein
MRYLMPGRTFRRNGFKFRFRDWRPFLLAAFDVGAVDTRYTTLTENLYHAQKRRWQTTHEITAASEDSLDRAPWFTYYNVSYQGHGWECRSHSGEPSPNNCGVSTKAAFGWAALFDDDYSQLLEKTARTLASADGYLAGSQKRPWY